MLKNSPKVKYIKNIRFILLMVEDFNFFNKIIFIVQNMSATEKKGVIHLD